MVYTSWLSRAIETALEMFSKKGAMEKLIPKVMERDFSWDASVREYVKLYARAVQTLRNAAA